MISQESLSPCFHRENSLFTLMNALSEKWKFPVPRICRVAGESFGNLLKSTSWSPGGLVDVFASGHYLLPDPFASINMVFPDGVAHGAYHTPAPDALGAR